MVPAIITPEEHRQRIRAELAEELKHQDVWYPLSRKNRAERDERDKLNNDLYKVPESDVK